MVPKEFIMDSFKLSCTKCTSGVLVIDSGVNRVSDKTFADQPFLNGNTHSHKTLECVTNTFSID